MKLRQQVLRAVAMLAVVFSLWLPSDRLLAADGLLPANPFVAAEKQGKDTHILLLMSYDIGYSWERDILAGIQQWAARQHSIYLTVEWIDQKQHPEPEHLTYFSQFFKQKYKNSKFDLIMTVDNSALRFAVDRPEFADHPIVFVGVNGDPATIIRGRKNITGIVESFYADKTIEMALKLHPNTQNMTVIINNDESGQGVLWSLQRSIERLERKKIAVPPLTTWLGLTVAQLKNRLPTLPADHLVFVFGTLHDESSNTLMQPEKTIAFIRQYTENPIYSDLDAALGHGVVGGYFNDAVANGRLASLMAQQILAGEPADQLPWVWQTPNKLAFDQNELARLQVSLKDLPTQSTVINLPPELMQSEYRDYFIWLMFCAALLAVLAVVFIAKNRLQKKQRRELFEFTMRDELTGLKNISWLRHYLKKLRPRLSDAAGREKISLLMLDLNRFKVVNDSRGHAVGDQLIQQVGKRLNDMISNKEGLARFEGDCFAVLLRYEDDADLNRMIGQYERVFAAAFELNGQRVVVTASAGLSSMPIAQLDADRLLREADTAMHEAKRAGNFRVVQFDQPLNERFMRHAQLEEALPDAIEQQRIQLYYQPIVHSLEHRTVAYEALARWHHPLLGAVPPPEFIQIAVETGLIGRLTLYLIGLACSEFPALLAYDPQLTLSVNVSVRDLYMPNFAEHVADILLEKQMPADRLALEVTEDMMMGDVRLVRSVLSELHVMGVRVSIDDFGTGYSSMSYLSSYRVNTIKIDQSFVRRLSRGDTSQKIIKAIVSMANDLGLMVITEGAETLEQVAILNQLGCVYIQGYAYGRPQPLAVHLQQWRDRVAFAESASLDANMASMD